MEQRLKTRIWIQAFMRRNEAAGFPTMLVTRGDEDAGAVLVKVNRFTDGCLVYTQVRDDNGEPAWLTGTGDAPVKETEADAYIDRQRQYDADLWVVEVEDGQCSYGMDGKILDA